jgi:hypothetical protein
MAFSTGNSFKVYKLPDMKIKLAGPYFNEKISCIQGINENIFLGKAIILI